MQDGTHFFFVCVTFDASAVQSRLNRFVSSDQFNASDIKHVTFEE